MRKDRIRVNGVLYEAAKTDGWFDSEGVSGELGGSVKGWEVSPLTGEGVLLSKTVRVTGDSLDASVYLYPKREGLTVSWDVYDGDGRMFADEFDVRVREVPDDVPSCVRKAVPAMEGVITKTFSRAARLINPVTFLSNVREGRSGEMVKETERLLDDAMGGMRDAFERAFR